MKILYQVADKYTFEEKQAAIELENIIEKYNLKNKIEINEAFLFVKSGLDVKPYLDMEFNNYQLQSVRTGLKEGLDISWYAKPEFNSDQMEQIKIGLENKVDVSIYAIP